MTQQNVQNTRGVVEVSSEAKYLEVMKTKRTNNKQIIPVKHVIQNYTILVRSKNNEKSKTPQTPVNY